MLKNMGRPGYDASYIDDYTVTDSIPSSLSVSRLDMQVDTVVQCSVLVC